ncbi:riboflavin synthase [Rubrobacter aplysinae]|uniref:riboflavin synthase n=1 Tax=Rubrobacter aplysinae TaxID=909625 RepID=UPI00064BD51B|nr:riboflavin synthase [Rubrobacter aplysinae]
MFTGLIENTGHVSEMSGGGDGGMHRLVISAPSLAGDVGLGESISVNGVCLTVGSVEQGRVTFNAMRETLRRSALGDLAEGDPVNLEPAMAVGDRLGGHMVQGHVDGVGHVLGRSPEGGAEIWTFAAPESVLRYTVEKGSICVDGISLTVVSVEEGDHETGTEGAFTVSVLPQTRDATNLGRLDDGARVNLEADVIGKHVERLLGPHVAHLMRSGP